MPTWNVASLVAHMVMNLPAMQATWVRPLGWENPLEKEMATYSSILFFFFNLFFNWRIIALQNFVVFCQTSTWISHILVHYSCLENSMDRGYSPWGHKESDTTERLKLNLKYTIPSSSEFLLLPSQPAWIPCHLSYLLRSSPSPLVISFTVLCGLGCHLLFSCLCHLYTPVLFIHWVISI